MTNTNAVTNVFQCYRCKSFYGEGMVHFCPTAATIGVTTTNAVLPSRITLTDVSK